MAKVKRGHWPRNPLHNLALNSPTGLNFLLRWMRIGCLYLSHTARRSGFHVFFSVLKDILGNMMLSYNACFEDPDHPTRMIHLKNDHRPSRNTAWHSSLWKASISQVDGAASRCRISCIFLGQRATLHSTSQKHCRRCGQWDGKSLKPSRRLKLKLQRSLGAWAYFPILSWFMQSIILVSSTTILGLAWLACCACFVWSFCSAEDSWSTSWLFPMSLSAGCTKRWFVHAFASVQFVGCFSSLQSSRCPPATSPPIHQYWQLSQSPMRGLGICDTNEWKDSTRGLYFRKWGDLQKWDAVWYISGQCPQVHPVWIPRGPGIHAASAFALSCLEQIAQMSQIAHGKFVHGTLLEQMNPTHGSIQTELLLLWESLGVMSPTPTQVDFVAGSQL